MELLYAIIYLCDESYLGELSGIKCKVKCKLFFNHNHYFSKLQPENDPLDIIPRKRSR